MSLPVWISMPHNQVKMKFIQPEINREVFMVFGLDDSRNVESAEAEVVSENQKSNSVACLICCKNKTEVSQQAKASLSLKIDTVAMPKECSISLANFSKNNRILEDLRWCSY